jgi:hypothetical protein
MTRQLIEWIYFAIIMVALLMVTSANAANLSQYQKAKIINVANYYGLNPNKLIRIAYVESNFNQDAIRHNKNGTVDVGFFQINTVHATTTCKYLDLYSFEGSLECAAILVAFHKRYSDADPMWLARYHSKTKSLKAKYYKKLQSVPIQYLAVN